VDRCLVSETLAKTLLQDGEFDIIDAQDVYLSDGKMYTCTAKFEARYNTKDAWTQAVTLFVTPGIKDQVIFPKGRAPLSRSNTIAPIEPKPRTAEQKKKDGKRDLEAKDLANVVVKEAQDRKKEHFTNASKEPEVPVGTARK